MERLDFKAIVAPYAAGREPEEVLGSLRSGLLKRFPAETVDASLAVVFARASRGKTFADLRELGKYCDREATKQTMARDRALTRVNEVNVNRMIAAATAPPTPWFALVVCVLAGLAVGLAFGWWWWTTYG